jgi:uncharacterized protein (TIGR00255 family)
MPASMTGYAHAAERVGAGDLDCELRSVNHRYADLSLRLPDELRMLEPRLRDLLYTRVRRGRLECTIRFKPAAAAGPLDLGSEVLEGLLAAAARLREREPELTPLSIGDLLRWPGVLPAAVVDIEQLGAQALELARRTLDALSETRRREGERLRALIEARLDEARALAEQVRAWLPEIAEGQRTRLLARVAELREQPDPARIEQELLLLLQRQDVAEELDRLRLHIEEVRATLVQDQAVGRRLDFLMQELNREANTLGSKAADARLSRAAVDLKVLIEQMREQVQNIE